jgi:hypothetical protein
MEQREENSTPRRLLALGLVGIIGLAGLLILFNETNSTTGQAVSLRVSRTPMVGCNADEVMLTARGVQVLKERGREVYGPDFSPYSDARANYNGVAYCADAEITRSLLG